MKFPLFLGCHAVIGRIKLRLQDVLSVCSVCAERDEVVALAVFFLFSLLSPRLLLLAGFS